MQWLMIQCTVFLCAFCRIVDYQSPLCEVLSTHTRGDKECRTLLFWLMQVGWKTFQMPVRLVKDVATVLQIMIIML